MRLRNIKGADTAIGESPYCIKEPASYRGRWQDAFPSPGPLHIEIGMGKGRFLMELASLHPDIRYLGIERYSSVLLRALQKMQADPLPNVKFLCMDAAELALIFSPGEVARIYLNFSDPWPKARHAGRRLTSREFLARYDRVLAEDGTIEFKTDNRLLFDFSVSEVNVSSAFHIKGCTYDLHHDDTMNQGNIMTEYEEKFSSLGNPICKLVVGRTS